MNTIRTLHKQWDEIYTRYENMSKRLSAEGHSRNSIYHELEKDAEALGFSYPIHWVDIILKPLAEALAEEAHLEHFSVDGPFGISSRVSLCLYRSEDDKKSNSPALKISILPDGLSRDDENDSILYMVDFTSSSDDFKPGTVGFYNGLNFGSLELDNDASMKDLLEVFKKQYEKELSL